MLNKDKTRKLASVYEPIRITSDYTQLTGIETITGSLDVKNSIIKQIELAKYFYGNLLNITRTIGNNMFPTSFSDCQSITVPSAD